MIDEEAKKIFESVRMVSVSNLALRLGVERDWVVSRLPEWESEGLIRIAKASGCGSCAGCASVCGDDESEPTDEKMLISQVKELSSKI
jgi:DNA-binding transcriptional MocR family regulator